MVTTATILFDQVQDDGRRRVKYEYTTDRGFKFKHGPFLIDSGVNAQADADSKISVIDDLIKEQDEKLMYRLFFDGKDMDDEVAAGTFATLNQNAVRRKCLRRLANILEDPTDRQVDRIIKTNTYVQSLSDNVIANRLTSASETWTNTQARTLIKDKLTALIDASNALPHGKGVLDEDE